MIIISRFNTMMPLMPLQRLFKSIFGIIMMMIMMVVFFLASFSFILSR
eukprot:UN21894